MKLKSKLFFWMILLQLIFSIIMVVLNPHQLYPQLFPFYFCGIHFSSHKHWRVQCLVGQALSYLNPVSDVLEEGAENLKWAIISVC